VQEAGIPRPLGKRAQSTRSGPAPTLPSDSILLDMGLQTALAGHTGGELAMNKFLSVGDIRIHRIVELEGPFLPALDIFPTLSAQLLDANRHWLAPKALSRDDWLVFCFQSYVVRTPHHTVLVDSCIGNDKVRPTRPEWNLKRDENFMRALAASGFSVGDVDFVMCTHLHVDHVGWNTRLQGGRWTPTFPKARYLISKSEFDYWTEQHAKTPLPHFADSVLPVMEARSRSCRGGAR